MGRCGNHSLRSSPLVLHKHIEQIAEMTGKFSRPHGGPQFQGTLKRHYFHIKPALGKQPLVGGDMQNHGNRRREARRFSKVLPPAPTLPRTKQAGLLP